MYDQNKADEFILRLERIIEQHDPNEAFLIASSEINKCEDIYLNQCITPLNYLRHEKTLDWIEGSAGRIINVNINWGHLAAASHFSWEKAAQWLNRGRPLSLIALDALLFCTTCGERLNQSPWMQENRPTLIDNPKPDIVARKLQEYLKIDNVPRTRLTIEKIINNLFEV